MVMEKKILMMGLVVMGYSGEMVIQLIVMTMVLIKLLLVILYKVEQEMKHILGQQMVLMIVQCLWLLGKK